MWKSCSFLGELEIIGKNPLTFISHPQPSLPDMCSYGTSHWSLYCQSSLQDQGFGRTVGFWAWVGDFSRFFKIGFRLHLPTLTTTPLLGAYLLLNGKLSFGLVRCITFLSVPCPYLSSASGFHLFSPFTLPVLQPSQFIGKFYIFVFS